MAGDRSIGLHWLGHATVLLEDRASILTDPLLTRSLVHLHRRGGPQPDSLLGRVDAVVISHLHADHLHARSLRLLDPGTPALVPRGAARLLRRSGLEVVEVEVGDVVPVGGATVTVVPAVHADSRWPWWPGTLFRADAVGFVVRGEGTTYFAGDTELFEGIADVAPAPDLALLPVGGWGPSRGDRHLDPEDAATASSLLQARVAVPIHYGTFWPRGMSRVRTHLFDDPGQQFAHHARKLAPEVEVRVLAPGSATSVSLRPGRGARAGGR